MNRPRAVDLAAKLLAAVLFALSLAALAFAVRGGTTDELVTALLGTYLTGALAVGVFRDLTDTRGWRIAFFSGVTVWAGYDYATGGDAFALVLLVVGVAMVAAAAFGVE
ncbi:MULTISPECIES: hypothetical protein [Halorussus]|uniref:hypothetical protein n=1 Tax=Halorussus TaxID=1070314 RepID=UPI00209E9521|nr:hypothetical protein [Halorussus vallis]USZ77119.1 hypothetical protein NGM07_07275 [Halorussus vallis]